MPYKDKRDLYKAQSKYRKRKIIKIKCVDTLARLSHAIAKLYFEKLLSMKNDHPEKVDNSIGTLGWGFQLSKHSIAYMFAVAYEFLEYGEAGRGPFAFVTDWILTIETCLKKPSKRNFEKIEWAWQEIPEEWKNRIQKILPPSFEDMIDLNAVDEGIWKIKGDKKKK